MGSMFILNTTHLMIASLSYRDIVKECCGDSFFQPYKALKPKPYIKP